MENLHQIRAGIGRGTGQQFKSSTGQLVLIGGAGEMVGRRLLRCAVGKTPDEGARRRECRSGVLRLRYPEVRQIDSTTPRVGNQDVARLDVTMEQAIVVCVVESVGDCRDDLGNQIAGEHPVGEGLGERTGVRAVDIGHGYPQSIAMIAAVIKRDDVVVQQRRRDVGLASEPFAELFVVLKRRRKDFECVLTRQPWMLREVHLTHSADAESPDDAIPGELVALLQGPGHRFGNPAVSCVMAIMITRSCAGW